VEQKLLDVSCIIPLQRHENPLNKGVGEPPRGLPQNKSEERFLGNRSKKWFFAVEPFDYNIKKIANRTVLKVQR
jgi:hypothetical protein